MAQCIIETKESKEKTNFGKTEETAEKTHLRVDESGDNEYNPALGVKRLIRAVFIDVDDTLLDFRESARLSALAAAEALGLKLPEHFMEIFMRNNDRLWRRIEEGTLTREQLHQVRWTTIFRELGMDADGIRMEGYFRERLRCTAVPIAGAEDALRFLSARFPLWAASNAPRQQQELRLGKAGLLSFLQGVLASSELGADKPSRAFFDACLQHAGPFRPVECLMIGDSMHADIMGAARAGWHTCWVHPREEKEESGPILPDWTVRDIRDILYIGELNQPERRSS